MKIAKNGPIKNQRSGGIQTHFVSDCHSGYICPIGVFINRHKQERDGMEKKDEKANERPFGWQINCAGKQSNSQTLATS